MPELIQRLPSVYETDGILFAIPKDDRVYIYVRCGHGYLRIKMMKVVRA